MNLNLATWQEFQLDHLFTIKKGKRLTSEEQEDGSNNYIGAIDSNNGVANHIAQPPYSPSKYNFCQLQWFCWRSILSIRTLLGNR